MIVQPQVAGEEDDRGLHCRQASGEPKPVSIERFLLEGAGYGVGSGDGYLDRRSALPQGEIQVDASGEETDRVRRSEVPAVVPN